MGLQGAVEWWEEWQLRILVLSSVVVQWLLSLTADRRKFAIPSWFRSIIWLAYLGSDALAIYALATLFNRQRMQDCRSSQGNSILEVVWAPVLLMHLGGQDVITAYDIEDNELWARHVVTAVSQVTVAIYVFFKSWSGSDKRLWQAAILFFVPGILKCIEKPWALKNASINSLVSYSGPGPKTNTDRESDVNSLKDYVQKTRAFVQVDNHRRQAQGQDNMVDLEADHEPRAQGEARATAEDLQSHLRPQISNTWRNLPNQQKETYRSQGYRLFVDLASPHPDRLGILKSFWVLNEKEAYALIQKRLFCTFDLIYTKRKMIGGLKNRRPGGISFLVLLSASIRLSAVVAPFVAFFLFSWSLLERHYYRKDLKDLKDLKVTAALFGLTFSLEYHGFVLSFLTAQAPAKFRDQIVVKWAIGKVMQSQLAKKSVALYERAKGNLTQCKWVPKMVALCEQAKTNFTQCLRAIVPQFMRQRSTSNVMPRRSLVGVGQYDLVGFFVRNKRHATTMCILSSFNCKEFFDQSWSMKPCNSSFAITELVLKYVKKGWEDQINDVDSYWKFSDRRGQWILQSNNYDQGLSWSLRRPFDESVLLWHIATDFCFYYMRASADCQCATAQCILDDSGVGHGCAVWCDKSAHHKRAVQCTEISNYMIYLLFVKPEMLLSGTRRNLLTTANAELEEILNDDNPSLKKILKGDKPSLMEILKCNKPFLKFLTGKKPLLNEIKRGFMNRIIAKVQLTENRGQVEGTDLTPDEERDATTQDGFIRDAWKLANALLVMGDNTDRHKMWEVIEGVWVEMLCFSASRCRGYLHAKSLGTGGELLTYIWLLLSHMGMETLPERLQRTELSSGEGDAGAPPSTSQIHEMEYSTRFRRSRSH